MEHQSCVLIEHCTQRIKQKHLSLVDTHDFDSLLHGPMHSGDLCKNDIDLHVSACLFIFNQRLNSVTISHQIPQHQILQKSLQQFLSYTYTDSWT